MVTDKTGAQTTVSTAEGKYTIAVDGETVGLAPSLTGATSGFSTTPRSMNSSADAAWRTFW
jgi:hypothetical protein